MNLEVNGDEPSSSRQVHSGEHQFEVGASRMVWRVKASGPRDFVESTLGTDPRSLIRSGVFVVTFVPITVALISKLPDIILALNAVFR